MNFQKENINILINVKDINKRLKKFKVSQD